MVSGDAILGAATVVGLAMASGCWRLAFLLARLQSKVDLELSHNGGGSLKDQARDAKVASIQALALIQAGQDELRQHISNSDMTHSAMWASITKREQV